jgi:hypothetical protein
MNNTTLEYESASASASSTVKVLVTLHFITIQIVGNLLWVGIIHFEKWGSDPQKRDLSNQLISFVCQLMIFMISVSGTIAYIRIMTSVPIGKVCGTIFVFTRQSSRICGILGTLEYLVHKNIQLFKWNIAANLNDDLVAHFLKVFNVCCAFVYTIGLFCIGQFHTPFYFLISGDVDATPIKTGLL